MRANGTVRRVALPVLLALIVFAASLATGLRVREARREAQLTVDLTPESIVTTLKDAGFAVSDVRDMDYLPGPMAAGERGIRCAVRAEGEDDLEILLVSTTDVQVARRSAAAVNRLNRDMDGTFGCALYRGPVVMLVGSSNRDAVARIGAVFRTAE